MLKYIYLSSALSCTNIYNVYKSLRSNLRLLTTTLGDSLHMKKPEL